MPVYRSLHLSDLHIGGTYLDSQELAYKITNDIARTGIGGIRNILVTGDIFHGPAGTDKALILEASRFFQTLMDELNEDGRTTALTGDNFSGPFRAGTTRWIFLSVTPARRTSWSFWALTPAA